eukprot:TRINITY_DN79472_c0_g1_i1.p1 TRINITY_DN79472_c0_g1~~TRINITY_DN79472_c0_g1_i1.p1  ORF type:complete len:245 (+),score=25.09 TRINITY_DN79472_c0_g1_i1:40-774(+)
MGDNFVGPLRWLRDPNSYEFLLWVPKSLEPSGKPMPLLLYLHGAGECGSHLPDIISEGATGTPPVELFSNRAPPALAERFVVAAPQSPGSWEVSKVHRLLDFLLGGSSIDLNLDASRLYVTGHSMGGGGALQCAAAGRFAAAVPVAGTLRGEADVLRRVPIWAFHGKNDACVPSSLSERIIGALRNAGVPEEQARLTLYDKAPTPPGYPNAVGHASTIPAYATLDMYDWLLSHSLRSPDTDGGR